MIEPAELPQLKETEFKANEIFTEAEITEYRRGCELVGIKLGEAIDRIMESGKRPTILIPSRGAIPIFLLGANYLRNSGDKRLTGADTNYYPQGIFEYLSDSPKDVQGNVAPQIDVILYPFTADLSETKDDFELDRKVRESCARAFSDLIYGDKKSLDLQWNFFLMQKFRETQYGPFLLKPSKIVESLNNIPSSDNREIILIDTVISGRASSDITQAFNTLGHKVTPILSVDSTGGIKLRKDYKNQIRNSVNHEYIDSLESQLIDFPLISEDKGAAVLGMSALNFSNFNDEELLKKIGNGSFPDHFLPQSCVWMIPPGNTFIPAFHGFLQRCGEGFDVEDEMQKRAWEKMSDDIREFISSREDPDDLRVDMGRLIKVQPNNSHETASHIISVKLTDSDASAWIREFTLKRLT